MSRIEKEALVMAPIDLCFQMWSNFPAFPQFMDNVKEIRHKGNENIWHWTIKGPITDINFDVEVDAMVPDKIVSWHTVRDADVSHSGAVTFESRGTNQTLVHVAMEYSPPIGKIGEFVADLLKNPEKMVEDDLNRFKALAEQKAAEVNTSTYPENIRREDI